MFNDFDLEIQCDEYYNEMEEVPTECAEDDFIPLDEERLARFRSLAHRDGWNDAVEEMRDLGRAVLVDGVMMWAVPIGDFERMM